MNWINTGLSRKKRMVFGMVVFTITIFNGNPLKSQITNSKLSGATNTMSSAYWEHWNPDVQEKIDEDIEKNRKSDAVFKIKNLKQCQQASFKFLFLKDAFKQICKLRLVVYK